MRLISPPGQIVGGSITFRGEELLTASRERMRDIRGNDIAMIFQDPMTSLNPVYKVGEQIAEALRLHRDLDRKEARQAAIDAMKEVSIPSPERRVNDYPHQLSGGMRQRVMIAMALSCDPQVLIADEPTTALDVTTQAQIVDLVERLQAETGTAVVWITHDLGIVAGIADRVLVMYGGRVVEEAGVDALYDDPRHPYTLGLLGALPVLGADRPEQLVAIPGLPPDPTALPPGCPFYPRCPQRDDERCAGEVPPLRPAGTGSDGHRVAAFYDADHARVSGGRR